MNDNLDINTSNCFFNLLFAVADFEQNIFKEQFFDRKHSSRHSDVINAIEILDEQIHVDRRRHQNDLQVSKFTQRVS